MGGHQLKTLVDLEKDLDSLPLLGKGEATDPWEAITTKQIKPESRERDQTPHDSILTIRSTPQGRIVYWKNTDHQTLSEVNLKVFDELSFQDGSLLPPPQEEETKDTRDLSREVLMVHIMEIQESNNDSMERVDLDY